MSCGASAGQGWPLGAQKPRGEVLLTPALPPAPGYLMWPKLVPLSQPSRPGRQQGAAGSGGGWAVTPHPRAPDPLPAPAVCAPYPLPPRGSWGQAGSQPLLSLGQSWAQGATAWLVSRSTGHSEGPPAGGLGDALQRQRSGHAALPERRHRPTGASSVARGQDTGASPGLGGTLSHGPTSRVPLWSPASWEPV